ncbi:MAG: thioredoxin family protein [Planctomycetales bacterium]|nr:thioredoxin family protein [Planctomycetales bacterium]
MFIARFASAALMTVAALVVAAAVQAQPPAPDGAAPPSPFPSLSLPPLGSADKGASQDDGVESVSAYFTTSATGEPAQLFVTVEMGNGWHTYSVTQPSGGPIRTRIDVTNNDAVQVTGPFHPDVDAEMTREAVFKDLPVETHHGTVTWSAPIEFAASTDPANVQITGTVMLQACTDTACLPPKKFDFTASWQPGGGAPVDASPPIPASAPAKPTESAAARPATATGEFRPADAHVAIRGRVEANDEAGTYRLVISAEPTEGYHVYELVERETGTGINKPTLLVLTETSGLEAGRPVADKPIMEKPSLLADADPARLYEGAVDWAIALSAPSAAESGSHQVAGVLGYQVCSDTACDRPQAIRFDADVPGTLAPGASVPVTFSPASYNEAAAAADAHPWPAATFDPSQIAVHAAGQSELSLGTVLFYGFVGGIILNLMPCVLPVVGLKIMSFVAQAGESRTRVLTLNIWFSLGLLCVFMLLAALAVFAQMGWGALFASDAFTIVMAAVVFAMGLSLLGVWEIPIPGFVGGTTAHGLESREGAAGAFSKGVITTILATPCSGPYMGTALTWALRQPSQHVFAVFLAIGLGMASPYLVIGAFPRLIHFLPKPGEWMNTFKSVMGFVLLGTVVYLLYLTGEQLVIPAVALLLGVGAACWWIGQTPLTAERSKVATAWISGAAIVAAVGLFAFGWLTSVTGRHFGRSVDRAIAQRMSTLEGEAPTVASRHEGELPWQPYTRSRLEQELGAGRTVLVDFTADWCLTCKTLEVTVLNTEAVLDTVDRNGVVTLVADWTNLDPGVTEMLNLLGANQVPVLAIFPAGRPNEPIVLVDGYTQNQLLTKLNEAGPSKDLAVSSDRENRETPRTASR